MPNGLPNVVCQRLPHIFNSGRDIPLTDAVVMFKTIILSALYNLSDDQVEHQIRDRLSFMRFLGLGLEDRVPDAKTVWLYREQLTQAGVIETLFETFDGLVPPIYSIYRRNLGILHHHRIPFPACIRSSKSSRTARRSTQKSLPCDSR